MKQVLKVIVHADACEGSSDVHFDISVEDKAPDFDLVEYVGTVDLSSMGMKYVNRRVLSTSADKQAVMVRFRRSPDAHNDNGRLAIQRLIQGVVEANDNLRRDFPKFSFGATKEFLAGT